MRYLEHDMHYKSLLFIPTLALFGQGCINVTVPAAPAPTETPAPSVASDAVTCPDLPKVYYFGKAYFSASEISEIERNVVRPVVAYYSNEEQGRVVSLTIRQVPEGVAVEGITHLSWTDDGGYFGFIHAREGGVYPMWEPFEVPEGYEG